MVHTAGQWHVYIGCHGQHIAGHGRALTNWHDQTAGQWHAYIGRYGQARGPVARSKLTAMANTAQAICGGDHATRSPVAQAVRRVLGMKQQRSSTRRGARRGGNGTGDGSSDGGSGPVPVYHFGFCEQTKKIVPTVPTPNHPVSPYFPMFSTRK